MAKKRAAESGSPEQPPQKQTRKRYAVTAEAFVSAWQTSSTAQEAADRLGMPKAIVLARAAKYRKDGVRLKQMKRGKTRTLDVAGLNRLIEELAESEEEKS